MGRGELTRRATEGLSLTDVAVALVVAALGQQEVWVPVHSLGAGGISTPGPRAALATAFLIVSLALAWRRRAPLLVLAVVTGLLSIQFLAFGSEDGLGAMLPVLVAFYAEGRWGNARQFPIALALTAAHTAVHEWRDPHFTLAGPSPAFWTVMLAASLVGRGFAHRADEIRTASARAAELELQSEQQYRQAAADERSRIARELHDLVGHGLSLLVLQLVAATSELENGETDKTLARLGRLETTARNTLAETRRLVTMMGDGHAELAPQPGIADLAALVTDVQASGIPTTFDLDPALVTVADTVPEGVGLTVYRLVQEALTNVVRHAAAANQVYVAVRRAGSGIEVEVADDAPPAPPRRATGGHRGLIGMRERVDLYGGTLTAGPVPSGGFIVRASIPVELSTVAAEL